MDFYRIITVRKPNGTTVIRPDWRVGRSKDLMTRGGTFYAVWDESKKLWSEDIYDVQRLVDEDLYRFAEEFTKSTSEDCIVYTLESNVTKLWNEFQNFVKNSGSNFHNLDENLVFSNTELTKTDYASKKLDYALTPGACPAWDTLIGALYDEENRRKIEWAIGSVVSGDSKFIQKFLVFYGPPGSGKSTILNIINDLFDGYTSVFDARELASANNSFATAAFKSNPLVAIQHDGDLSRIYDNTKLNSIVAHEILTVNEKYKAPYEARSNAFLFLGTNLPVKITDAKSGIIRRLIDVVPSGQTIEHNDYHRLLDKIRFEYGTIAYHCYQVYKELGSNYYSDYRPTEMMLQTDVFYNFVEAHFDIFKTKDGVTLKQAWALYKTFCTETGIPKMLPQYKLREELKHYFHDFHDRIRIDGVDVRSYYSGFKSLEEQPPIQTGERVSELDRIPSIFDTTFKDCVAQYASDFGSPNNRWDIVTTTLSDIDTSRLHYVMVPENHIVIDFDLTDESGEKSLEINLEKARAWPETYMEVSKSGNGVHLHYTYDGNVDELSNIYDVGIEIKHFTGRASLRRRLTLCNSVPIANLSGGLPRKEKKVLDINKMKSEKTLRNLVVRNIRKEIHPGTKPSIDFISKILDDAYTSGMSFDLTDMQPDILTFASRSTNNSQYCIKQVQKMIFRSDDRIPDSTDAEGPIVFFDVEIYPNLFVVCWKKQGSDTIHSMVNPGSSDIETLLSNRLIGFNNRRYDNHILYAAYLGYTNEQLYDLSASIIASRTGSNKLFGEAYNLSYADIYDFSSKKQGLKKFEIELGISHMELSYPWDEPIDESLWDNVVEYCKNDVAATEAVFDSRKADFVAREILAELSGLKVNDTTQAHTAKIIFGNDKNHKNSFVYTDLSKEFHGYKFDAGVSEYRHENPGEGGYVYAEPGFYRDVVLLDVASMHPTSIEQLNLFGVYTERFSDLKKARMAIKHKDFETARSLLDGKLGKFLDDIESADALSYALKIVINIVYGLTSAKFDNPFNDKRNVDNIVAKRGALFMIDLKHAVQNRGFSVCHIKTDSIKIPGANSEIIDFVIDFGKKYGYDFEVEGTYDKFCLVNQAVYVAHDDEHGWTAVGAQFQHPYVYKSIFGGANPVFDFDDFCETKSVVQGAMYLETEENGESKRKFVGRTGSFVPVESGGGKLLRVKDDKDFAVVGTKGYSWIEREIAKDRSDMAEGLDVDFTYFENLTESAIKALNEFVSTEELLN